MKDEIIICFYQTRCARYDPRDYWKDNFGRPFGFSLTDRKCIDSWYHGQIEKFCKVVCDVDGFCTETVKQRKCSCPSGAPSGTHTADIRMRESCVTLQYQVMNVSSLWYSWVRGISDK